MARRHDPSRGILVCCPACFRSLCGLIAACLLLVDLARNAPAAPPSGSGGEADEAARKALEQRFAERVQPLLKRYCLGCHGKAKQEGKQDKDGDGAKSGGGR